MEGDRHLQQRLGLRQLQQVLPVEEQRRRDLRPAGQLPQRHLRDGRWDKVRVPARPPAPTAKRSVPVSPAGLQTVASRVHFREQYRALVGHALVWARVLLLLRALSVPGDTV